MKFLGIFLADASVIYPFTLCAYSLRKSSLNGIEEGETNKAKAIAKAMKDRGMDNETISELTGLGLEVLENL